MPEQKISDIVMHATETILGNLLCKANAKTANAKAIADIIQIEMGFMENKLDVWISTPIRMPLAIGAIRKAGKTIRNGMDIKNKVTHFLCMILLLL